MNLPLLVAAISGQALVNGLIILVVAALIFWAVTWFVRYVGIPEPFNKVIRVLVGLLALLFIINFLLSLVDKQFIRW